MIGRLTRPLKYLLAGCGVRLRMRTEDRRVLEEVVFPYFSRRPDIGRVLFVGCDWYTAWYHRVFSNAEFWTLDYNPQRRHCGAPNHIVDGVQHVRRHFATGSLDVIFCNGVFGWGLNEPAAVRATFEAFSECLRPEGIVVLGWNDCEGYRPFPPEQCADLLFNRWSDSPLGSWRYRTASPMAHIYDFYILPRNPGNTGNTVQKIQNSI